MPEVTITTEPQTVEIEEEITWQSVFSEIRQSIQQGFDSLRNEMTTQREASQVELNRLQESNTNLTAMITSTNQTLLDKLTSLTPNPSTPEIVEVVVEPTLESVEVENPEALISEDPPIAPARAKRRTL